MNVHERLKQFMEPMSKASIWYEYFLYSFFIGFGGYSLAKGIYAPDSIMAAAGPCNATTLGSIYIGLLIFVGGLSLIVGVVGIYITRTSPSMFTHFEAIGSILFLAMILAAFGGPLFMLFRDFSDVGHGYLETQRVSIPQCRN